MNGPGGDSPSRAMRLAPIIRVLIVVALGVASVLVVLSKRPKSLAAGDPLVLRNASGSDIVAVIKTPSGGTEQIALVAHAAGQAKFDPGMTLHVFIGQAKGISAGSWTITAIAGPLDIEVGGGQDLGVGITAEGLASQDAGSLHINTP